MRTFMAVEPSEEVRSRIADLQKSLREKGFNGRWPEFENIHVTLFFFGEADEPGTERIKESMNEVVPLLNAFTVETGKIGFFGNSDLPRVVWMGCEDEELSKLRDEIKRNLKTKGFSFDDRYTPHITVGRIKSAPGDWKKILSSFGTGGIEFGVGGVSLFSSRLTPKGSVYEVIHRSLLGGNANA